MNPLTLVKRIQNINSKEASLGISEEASWHAKYKDSAYVFVGGIPFDLTEGDLLAVFAQYGEIVDVNLVRDKGTGKSKGFAFIAYEDQRSTNLAVDNLNGAQILGRIIRVDHVTKYKKKEEEDEEAEQQKREARGVCRAFQRGECTRGAGCKFSHDEQRAANTGWGAQDSSPTWGHDKFEGPKKNEKRYGNERLTGSRHEQSERREEQGSRKHDADVGDRKVREEYNKREDKKLRTYEDGEYDSRSKENSYKRDDKRTRGHRDFEFEPKSKQDDYRKEEKRLKRHSPDASELRSSREGGSSREEKRSGRIESDSYYQQERDKRRGERSSEYGLDSSSHLHIERKESGHGMHSSSHRQRERSEHRHKSER
ncbi:hypothetical protein Tsubulata_003579 [Turnera subulata]|uniref:RRM domain-containing protein n=1 Tax=Turnera subulata TaxID=218843 RepID=A0A9Q0FQF7_9ROSI|nr:hypothetical protein Tsubulata_003579 [Turnera subulata]